MIRFFTTAKHAYTIEHYVEMMGDRIAAPIVPMTYSQKNLIAAGQPATYVFSDLERVPPLGLAELSAMWKRLESAGGNRLLNHPTRVMRRYELLRTLYEAGINEFNVYRLTEARRPSRYPAFIRREDEHQGPASRLLHNEAELDQELRSIERRGLLRDNLIVVEFCDTRDRDGLIRKYGTACVAGDVRPFHVYFSRQPVIKTSSHSTVTPETAAEELRYFEENPHADQVRRIFEMARIDYGRIDYGFRNGRVQVWEINTNPGWTPQGQQSPLRESFLQRRAEWLAEAFAKIDTP